ncbi:MAG: DegT/DnrJ/EryC1/StrS family aminotransferase [Nitrospirae bacterium]|nr:DegT/DnrJ/EryC1/StrS family aminotransferase [Nitrospirota bacterium]
METPAAIPFHRPYITEDEISEVLDSLYAGWLTMGPKTIAFEAKYREYIGSRNAVSMNSCTACLHLALKAVNIKKGDEVIVPAITFAATAEVVTYFHATPVFVDVDEGTHTIDVSKIEEKITKKTKAIIPVHYAGQPCDMDEILDIAKKHGLFVIEDAAHAVPAWYKERKIGTIGDITCFSFYATKSLTTGEGGMATTENDEWAERMSILRLHGISKDAWKRYTNEGSWYYEVAESGYKYNMTDIQAGLGLAQLKKVDWMWHQREEIARKYAEAFQSMDEITPPRVKSDRKSAWHLYVIKLNPAAVNLDRKQFMEELKERGIGTSVHFIPLYRHPYYRDTFRYTPQGFPVSERVYERIVSLPIYPGMTEGDIERVAESVRDVVRRHRR